MHVLAAALTEGLGSGLYCETQQQCQATLEANLLHSKAIPPEICYYIFMFSFAKQYLWRKILQDGDRWGEGRAPSKFSVKSPKWASQVFRGACSLGLGRVGGQESLFSHSSVDHLVLVIFTFHFLFHYSVT